MPPKLPTDSPALDAALHRLAEGAQRHASRSPAERGMLALQTAQAVAAVAIPWGETAAAMKLVLEPGSRGGPQAGPTPAAVLAEETATGPLGTVRLLVLTAQTLADVQRGGLPKLSARPRPGHPDRRGDRLHGGLEDYVEVDVLP